MGRVTSRLPLELADDVVGSALELLDDDEEPNAWHGGCLVCHTGFEPLTSRQGPRQVVVCCSHI